MHKLSIAVLQSGTGLNANELKQFLLKYNISRTPTITDNKIILNETLGSPKPVLCISSNIHSVSNIAVCGVAVVA